MASEIGFDEFSQCMNKLRLEKKNLQKKLDECRMRHKNVEIDWCTVNADRRRVLTYSESVVQQLKVNQHRVSESDSQLEHQRHLCSQLKNLVSTIHNQIEMGKQKNLECLLKFEEAIDDVASSMKQLSVSYSLSDLQRVQREAIQLISAAPQSTTTLDTISMGEENSAIGQVNTSVNNDELSGGLKELSSVQQDGSLLNHHNQIVSHQTSTNDMSSSQHDQELSLQEQRFQEQSLQEQRFEEQRFEEQSLREQRFQEQSLLEQRFQEQRFQEQRFDEQSLHEQRLEEQRFGQYEEQEYIDEEQDSERQDEQQQHEMLMEMC